MLDTNVLSALARDPQGRVFQTLLGKPADSACTSVIVAAEVQFGLQRGASARVRLQMQTLLSGLDILPLQSPADVHYGDIRSHLEKLGQPIGANDLLIAAHARSLGLVLVTYNLREFARVPGLLVEDWLSATA